MLIKLIIAYVLLFGESFKFLGFNWALIFLFLSSIYQIRVQSKKYFFFLCFIFSFALFSFFKYKIYYVSQDSFLFLVLIWGYFVKIDIKEIRCLIRFSLIVLFFKTMYLFFIPTILVWGSGDFLDGNVFDFGIYKRIQIKGADAILMSVPLFFRINRFNIFNFIFFILLIFAGSRALFGFVILILFLNNFRSFLPLLKVSFISLAIYFFLFNYLGFGERISQDDGRGEEWRLLEASIILDEISDSLMFGNGLGSGFIMPVASGSTLEDGINLYSHNILTWLLLKGGVFFLIFYLIINLKILLKVPLSHKISILSLVLLNSINNYIATFTGALLYSIYLNYLNSNDKN